MELPEELIGIEEELDADEEPDVELPDEEPDVEEAEPEEDEERVNFLVFELGDRDYALHVDTVLRILDVGERTRVPRSSAIIDGITDLRGDITAVIDPRVLLGLPESDLAEEDQDLVVFYTGPDAGRAGVRVDSVQGVERIPVSRVVLAPEEVETDQGTVEDLLGEPNVAGLLRDPTGADGYVPVLDIDEVIENTRAAIV